MRPAGTPVAATDERALPGLVCAVVGAIAFSGKAIIVKLVYRHGVDAVTAIMLRMAFALPLFMLMAWWAGRGRPALTRSDWLGATALGITGYYLASYLDFEGLQYISASLERLIVYLNPTLVVLMAWWFHKRPLRRAQLAGMAMSYAGVLLVFGHEARVEGEHVVLGSLLVVASTLSYAIYMTYSSRMVSRLGSLRLVGVASSIACALCIGQFLLLRPVDGLQQLPAAVLWLSVLNATLGTVVPVLLVMMAIERIGPAMTAQLGMIGPISTILMGIVLLGEPLNAWIAGGTLLVMTGIYKFTRPARG